MRKSIVIASLGLALATSGGIAVAQETINADGSSGASNAVTNPSVDADGPTIVYGDLNPGPGTNVIAPPPPSPGTGENLTATSGAASTLGGGEASAAPGTVTRDGVSGTSLLGPDGTYSVSDSPDSTVTVGDAAPAPVASAPAPEVVDAGVTAEPVIDNSAPVDSTDLDGDNYPDAQELELGLDPGNIDGDGDGVADGDELNIYGTDPFTWDSDGDGLSDGTELYETRTDPLVWDTDGDGVGDGASSGAVPAAADTSTAAAASGDSDGDRLSDTDEAAVGTDPGNPDSDGDGYYDGDEVVQGADPFDPGSFPAV
jgi:hypothetical protein